jgi:hypothetical protein
MCTVSYLRDYYLVEISFCRRCYRWESQWFQIAVTLPVSAQPPVEILRLSSLIKACTCSLHLVTYSYLRVIRASITRRVHDLCVWL